MKWMLFAGKNGNKSGGDKKTGLDSFYYLEQYDSYYLIRETRILIGVWLLPELGSQITNSY